MNSLYFLIKRMNKKQIKKIIDANTSIDADAFYRQQKALDEDVKAGVLKRKEYEIAMPYEYPVKPVETSDVFVSVRGN